MILEKVVLKMDIKKIDEMDFLSAFFKHYSADKEYLSKSFGARMNEDIERRQNKDINMKSAQAQYRYKFYKDAPS